MKKWYVVHTYSGHENKVKTYIEATKENVGVGDKIGRVIVPTEEVVEMKDGRKTTALKKFLPSYLLVELDMDKESLYFVTSVPGVDELCRAGPEATAFARRGSEPHFGANRASPG